MRLVGNAVILVSAVIAAAYAVALAVALPLTLIGAALIGAVGAIGVGS